jgi:hypothetical protein
MLNKILIFLVGIFLKVNSVLADNVPSKIMPNKYKGNMNNLPDGDLSTHFIPRIIDIILKLFYVLAVFSFLYAGVLMIVDADEEKKEKAKMFFVYGIVASLVSAVSYTIIKSLFNLNIL